MGGKKECTQILHSSIADRSMNQKKEKNKCLVCGKETINPRFCSRSCAATYNNKKTPKRQPEGHCERCGCSLITVKRFCDTCKAIVDKEISKVKEGLVDIRLPDGSASTRKIKPVHSSLILSFNVGKFSEDSLCGDLIDAIIGICLSDTKYIRTENKTRYISWLEAFRKFDYHSFQTNGIVADLPVKVIALAMEEWIYSFFGGDHHPLMSSYALDAAHFVDRMLRGGFIMHSVDRYWQLQPLIPKESYYKCIRMDTVFDSRFKKGMTEKLKGLIVKLNVPNECIVEDMNGRVVFKSDSDFYCGIERCHLSSHIPGWPPPSTLKIVQPPSEGNYIEDNFEFDGSLVITEGSADKPNWHYTDVYVKIPVRWFTHVYKWVEETRQYVALPVPEWK